MRTHVRAVHVPWQSSPSESLIGFSGKEGEATVTLSAFLGPHVVAKIRKKLSETIGKEEDIPDLQWNGAGYCCVTVTFRSLVTFQIHPPQMPYGLLDESQYDFSEIPLYDLGLSLSMIGVHKSTRSGPNRACVPIPDSMRSSTAKALRTLLYVVLVGFY
jgi:hypothetical protein